MNETPRGSDARGRLIAEIDRQGGLVLENFGLGPRRVPVVPRALFFDGNHDEASMGANLWPSPGIRRFADVLEAVEQRPGVSAVYVGISEVMPEPEYPFSDHVYVITSASDEDVHDWVAELGPDRPGVGPLHGFRGDEGPRFPLPVPEGQHAVLVWWD